MNALEERQITDLNSSSHSDLDPLEPIGDFNLDNETPLERKRRLNRLRKHRWIQRQSEDVLHRLRVENRERKRMRRLTETDEEKALRLRLDARRRANKQLSEEQKIKRRRNDAERQRKMRAKKVRNEQRHRDNNYNQCLDDKNKIKQKLIETSSELENIPVFIISKDPKSFIK